MGCSFRDVNRNGDMHLCPRTIRSIYRIAHRYFRPLTHPAKTPVRIAFLLNGFGLIPQPLSRTNTRKRVRRY